MTRLWIPMLAALGAVACDGSVSLRARVLDQDRAPIPGATVALSEEGFEGRAVTGDDGCVELFGVVAPGRYPVAVTVEAPGRKSLAGEIETLVSYRCDLVLVSETSPASSEWHCRTRVDYETWSNDCPDPVWEGVEWR